MPIKTKVTIILCLLAWFGCLLQAKSFKDFFLPMEPQQALVETSTWGVNDGIWGDSNVSPRDTANGLEDASTKQWCYWDGKILKADNGKYYMYASRWSQSFSHSVAWKNDSKAIYAVSDHIMGPYIDQGLVYPNHTWEDSAAWHPARGSNIVALRMHDGRYAVVSSEITPGNVWASEHPDGPFEYLGKIQYDCNGFSCGLARYNFSPNHMSNVKMMLRNDGRYMIIPRTTAPMISDNGILGPYNIMANAVYHDHPDIPQEKNEDPALWYSGGLYHILFNHWPTATMYHFTSEDGINDWTYRGVAINKAVDKLFKYTDGTINDWKIVERPTAYVDDQTGHVTHFMFSVLDVNSKGSDGANDNHASKIVIVPFDGEAFDAHMQAIIHGDTLQDTTQTTPSTPIDAITSHTLPFEIETTGVSSFTIDYTTTIARDIHVDLQRTTPGNYGGCGSRIITVNGTGTATFTFTPNEGSLSTDTYRWLAYMTVEGENYTQTIEGTNQQQVVTLVDEILTLPSIFTIEAEDFTTTGGHINDSTFNGPEGIGVKTRDSYIEWVNKGDYAEYTVNIPTSNTYFIQYLIASPNDDTEIEIWVDNQHITTDKVPNTNGWYTFEDYNSTASVYLSQGEHSVSIKADTTHTWQWNLDNITFSSQENIPTITEEHRTNDTKIFPNPFDDYLKVESKDIIESVTIYAIDGMVVEQQLFANCSITLDTKHLSPGIYFLEVLTDNHLRSSHKIIKY